VRLFLYYARQVRANYEPDRDEYRSIAQICRLLEGMPLAIQLAAAWARVLSAQEILRRAGEKHPVRGIFDFYDRSSKRSSERHRSLQAAFDYSWRLLDEHERKVLCRLSVFEALPAGSCRAGCRMSLSGLAGLMINPWCLRSIHAGTACMTWFTNMFVKLKENPDEMLATLEKHCRYYGDLLQPYVYRLKGRTQAELQAMVAAEIDNFHQAWDWALKNKRTREIQLLSQGFTWYYELRGWYQEGLAVFKQAVAALSSLESAPGNLVSAERLSCCSPCRLRLVPEQAWE